MTASLFTEFNALSTSLNASQATKASTLEVMNNLVGNFDQSNGNTAAEAHVDAYWAVSILEDAGDDGSADWYRKLHPQLMNVLGEEKQALEKLNLFLTALNLNYDLEQVLGNDLEVAAIRMGKIIVDTVGNS